MNQSLAAAIPKFIDALNVWFKPRTKAMESRLSEVVAVYIEELDIKTGPELTRLAHLIVNKYTQNMYWPCVDDVRQLMRNHDRACERHRTTGEMIERGTPQWDAWLDYYEKTAPKRGAFRLKYMNNNNKTSVPSAYPPRSENDRSAA